jgi:hypothetical protein
MVTLINNGEFRPMVPPGISTIRVVKTTYGKQFLNTDVSNFTYQSCIKSDVLPMTKCSKVFSGNHMCLSYTGVPGGKVNILGGHSIGHSKQESVYVHMPYSKLFPRQRYFTVQFQNC